MEWKVLEKASEISKEDLSLILNERVLSFELESLSSTTVGYLSSRFLLKVTICNKQNLTETKKLFIKEMVAEECPAYSFISENELTKGELLFYCYAEEKEKFPVPKPFYPSFSHNFTPSELLITEYLGEYYPPDYSSGMSIKEAKGVLKGISIIHSTSDFWSYPGEEVNPSLTSSSPFHEFIFTKKVDLAGVKDLFLDKIKKTGEIFKDKIEDFEDHDFTNVLDHYESLRKNTPNYSQSLINGDFWVGNVLLPNGFNNNNDGDDNQPNENDIKLIDWQFVCRGNALWDVSYFLSVGMNSSLLLQHESDLIDYYYNCLIENGIDGKRYTRDQCKKEYLHAKVFTLFIYVASISAFYGDYAKDHSITQLIEERFIALFQDTFTTIRKIENNQL